MSPDSDMVIVRYPDMVTRCNDVLLSSWLRAGGKGTPWAIRKSRFRRLMQESEAGIGMPNAWARLLFAANAPEDLEPSISESLLITEAEFEELRALSALLGDEIFVTQPPTELGIDEENEALVEVGGLPHNTGYKVYPGVLLALSGGGGVAAVCLLMFLLVRSESALSGARAELNASQSQSEATLTAMKSAQADALQAKEELTLAQKKQDSLIVAMKESHSEELRRQQEIWGKRLQEATSKQFSRDPKSATVVASVSDRDEILRELRPSARDASLSNFLISPSASAIDETSPTFRWNEFDMQIPESTSSLEVQLFVKGKDGKLVWKSNPPIPRSESDVIGKSVGVPRLERGQSYEWQIVDADTQQILAKKTYFYILSASQSSALKSALREVKTLRGKVDVYLAFGMRNKALELIEQSKE